MNTGMSNMTYNINSLRNIILDRQHLLKKSFAGNQFVGFLDCKMDWKTRKFIMKERNIFNHDFNDCKAIYLAIEKLAAFHEAKEIIENAFECI